MRHVDTVDTKKDHIPKQIQSNEATVASLFN